MVGIKSALTTSRRPPSSASEPAASLPPGAGAAGLLAEHWQSEAERLSLELDLARAQAEQWRRLCAAAMVECARFEADLAILKGETYLTQHGWTTGSQRDPGKPQRHFERDIDFAVPKTAGG